MTPSCRSFHLTLAYKPTQHETLTIDAFNLLKVIGKGSFEKVMQVRKKDTQHIYVQDDLQSQHCKSSWGDHTYSLREDNVGPGQQSIYHSPYVLIPESDQALSSGHYIWCITQFKMIFLQKHGQKPEGA